MVAVSVRAVVLVSARSARSASGCGSAAVKGRVAICIIKLPLLRIAQNRIGLADVLEFLFSVFISGICVRMILLIA